MPDRPDPQAETLGLPASALAAAQAVNGPYDASAIQVLEGLAAVRKRPGMYIGTTGPQGLHHLVSEIVDNAVDEAMAGHAQVIEVTLYADGGLSVKDDGRGIPVDLHETGVPALELVMTRLHAGGKFGGGGYRVSGGLHGVGAAVVNALSRRMVVETFRGGHLYRQEYRAGGTEIGPLEDLGRKGGRGTRVSFWPDPLVFPTVTFDREVIANRLREVAYLNAGLTFHLRDLRPPTRTRREAPEGPDLPGPDAPAGPDAETFCFPNGLTAFITDLLHGDAPSVGPIGIQGSSEGIEVEACLAWAGEGYSETLLSFVNSVPTPDGGTHEAGLRGAITRAVNEYAREARLLKDKAPNLQGEDVREGLRSILSIRLEDPLFEGQTKTRLGSQGARAVVEAVCAQSLTSWLTANPKPAQAVVQNAVRAQEAREAARKARDAVRSGRKRGEGPLLGGKLAACQVRDPQRAELFIVEGDSAGGSAKQARDRRYQAILPLRGKPLNTESLAVSQALQNEELATLVHTIGTGTSEEFDIRKCNYRRIIILADADSDGGHIQALLLTFFFKHMRGLIMEGRVFVAKPPLFRVATAKASEYVWDEPAVSEARKRLGAKAVVTRFKGLGEMQPALLREAALDPQTRRLVEISLEDAADAEHVVSLLMNDRRAEDRRRWIARHVPMGTQSPSP